MNTFYLSYHVDRMARLMQAGDLSGIRRYIKAQDESIQQALSAWAYSLAPDFDQDPPKELPKSCLLNLLGWQKFYQHDYLASHDLFIKAYGLDDWQQYAPEIALGFAKVYTRTGHWAAARAWCISYMQNARQNSNYFAMAKGYGALAEVFLRANHAKEALACFQMAYHLMPLQHSQKSRQYNFMASALIRHGEWLRAETLLNTSRQLSENSLNHDSNDMEAVASLLHSEMRLMFMALESGKSLPKFKPVLQEDCTPKGLQIMPMAMSYVARGLFVLQDSSMSVEERKTLASEYLIKASIQLEDHAPIEQVWVIRLLQALGWEVDGVVLGVVQQIFVLDVIMPPTQPVVSDRLWMYPELDNQGFELLMERDASMQSLIDFWKKLFI